MEIQAAIDAVAALPLDENGFRGAILLQAGQYDVSWPGLEVLESGIVIRGQGQGKVDGTKLIFTSTSRGSYAVTFGKFRGGIASVEPDRVNQNVTDLFVPVGSKTITINDASSFSVGDSIIVRLTPNQDWLVHSKCRTTAKYFSRSPPNVICFANFDILFYSVKHGAMGLDYERLQCLVAS